MVFLFIIILFVILIIFSKINIEIKTCKYNTETKENSILLIFRLLILNKIPIIKIKLDKKSLKKIYQKIKLKQFDFKDLHPNEMMENLKKLKISGKKFDLKIKVGVENVVATAYIVALFGISVSYLIKLLKIDYKSQKYVIRPMYNKNLFIISFSGIFEIKLIHIINMILVKRGGKL